MYSRLGSIMLLVVVCLFGILANHTEAGIFLEGDSIHVSNKFVVEDNDDVQDTLPAAWNPTDSVEACTPESEPCQVVLKDFNKCHFKILDSAGCIVYNVRLTPDFNSEGLYIIGMSLPIGVALDSQTIVFSDTSDFTSFDHYYGSVTLEEAKTYSFQITSQININSGECNPVEESYVASTIYIECCDGIRGNVDNDPEEKCQLVDITLLGSYLTYGTELPCPTEADVDGDGDIDWDDFDYLYAYVYLNGPAPASCP